MKYSRISKEQFFVIIRKHVKEVNFKMEVGNIQAECIIYKLTFFVKSTQTY